MIAMEGELGARGRRGEHFADVGDVYDNQFVVELASSFATLARFGVTISAFAPKSCAARTTSARPRSPAMSKTVE